MKKLKLIKPWRLPTVRLKLDASPAPAAHSTAPVGDFTALAERNCTDLTRCAAPYTPARKRRAPAGRAIFASTASPHPGCPHLFS